MSYPDFISNAPNYAEQFLRISRNQQETDNDAITNWLKQVQAAKLQQEIDRQPEQDAEKAALQDAEIGLRQAQRDQLQAEAQKQQMTLPELLTSIRQANERKALDLQTLGDQHADNALASEFTGKITALSPDDFADPDVAGKIVTDYATRAKDPTAVYNAYATIASRNPAFLKTVNYYKERQGWTPAALDTFKNMRTDGDVSLDDAMAAGRSQFNADQLQAKADAARVEAQARAEGKAAADSDSGLTSEQVTAARAITTAALSGELDKLKIDPGTRAAVAGDVLNSVGPDGKIDSDALQRAIARRVSTRATPSAAIDRYFK